MTDRPESGAAEAVARRRRRWPWAAAVVLLSLVAFVLAWFQPQKLFIDERVDEALPVAMASPTDAGTPTPSPTAPTPTEPSPTAMTPSPSPEPSPEPPEPTGPVTLARGRFRSLEHQTTGVARIVELEDGRRILRFEDLNTSNGPDLRVYLSEIPAGDDWYAYGERFVDLGDLKGNLGSQNYRIPDGVDLSRIRSAVIWCRRFTVGFGVAPLRV